MSAPLQPALPPRSEPFVVEVIAQLEIRLAALAVLPSLKNCLTIEYFFPPQIRELVG